MNKTSKTKTYMPRAGRKAQTGEAKPAETKKPQPSEPLTEIRGPVLLCDIELTEYPKLCDMLDKMIAQRKKLVESDETKWDFAKTNELFRFLLKEVYDKILSENIFLSMDLADFFQAFCDLYKKYLKSHSARPLIASVYKTKMKYLFIQILDEIVKEVFHMEDEEEEDYDDDFEAAAEEAEEALPQRGEKVAKVVVKNPAKDLYKQF